MYLNVFGVSALTLISSVSCSIGFAREVIMIVPFVSRTSLLFLIESAKYFVSPFFKSISSYGSKTSSLSKIVISGYSYGKPLSSFFSTVVVNAYFPSTGAVNLTTLLVLLLSFAVRWNG